MAILAVNIVERYSVAQWEAYWREAGGGDAIYARDEDFRLFRQLGARSSGATVVFSRTGEVVLRDHRATSYEALRAAIEQAL